MLYELLVYRQAFEAETQPAVLMKILSDQPAPLAMLDPMVDAGVATVVYKALAKNPADRYQDLGAMKADLVRIVQRLETEASDGRTMMVSPPPPRGMQVVPTNPPSSPGTGAADRVTRHFAAIEAALAAGDDARARQELQLATQAAPGHPRLGEMGAKISQARTARELARSIGEARARLAAGALTEAGQWLARAQKVAPQAPEVAELRQEIERAADGREQERDRQRRVAAALAHAREAMRAGSVDACACAPSPRPSASIRPTRDALALRAEVEAARSGSPPPHARLPGTGSRPAVGPPPPASARQLTGQQARPLSGSRPAAGGAAAPRRPSCRCTRRRSARRLHRRRGWRPTRRSSASSSLPLAFVGIAAVVAILFAVAAYFVYQAVSKQLLRPEDRAAGASHAGRDRRHAAGRRPPSPTTTTDARSRPAAARRAQPDRAAHRAAGRAADHAAVGGRRDHRAPRPGRDRVPGAADGDRAQHAGQPDRRGAAARRPAPDRRAVGARAADARRRGARRRPASRRSCRR